MEAFRHHSGPHPENQFSIEVPPSHPQVKQAERKAKAKPNILRIIIRLITLVIGLAEVGVLAAAVAVWYITRNRVLSQPGKLPQPGWPAKMDLKPTYVLLSAAIIAVIVQILALFSLVGPVSFGSHSAANHGCV